jgi:hypothetical protein
VIIHEAARLHVRVADRRSHELESALQELLAQRVGLRRPGRYILERSTRDTRWLAVDESPDKCVERAELVADLKEAARIGNERRHLETVPHDAGITEKRVELPLAVSRNALGIEAIERLTIPVAVG